MEKLHLSFINIHDVFQKQHDFFFFLVFKGNIIISGMIHKHMKLLGFFFLSEKSSSVRILIFLHSLFIVINDVASCTHFAKWQNHWIGKLATIPSVKWHSSVYMCGTIKDFQASTPRQDVRNSNSVLVVEKYISTALFSEPACCNGTSSPCPTPQDALWRQKHSAFLG